MFSSWVKKYHTIKDADLKSLYNVLHKDHLVTSMGIEPHTLRLHTSSVQPVSCCELSDEASLLCLCDIHSAHRKDQQSLINKLCEEVD